MGWWQITQDMYMGDEVADLLEGLTKIDDGVVDILNGIYQRDFGRPMFKEELKAALDFVQIDTVKIDCVIDWDRLPARGIEPEYGSGLGFAMKNLPGLLNDT
jgi:hypothetical protein